MMATQTAPAPRRYKHVLHVLASPGRTFCGTKLSGANAVSVGHQGKATCKKCLNIIRAPE